jgi:long-chain acyl-CoA synthetase
MSTEERNIYNSYEIGEATPTDGKVRRSFFLPFGEPLLDSPHPTIKTLYDILLYGSREFPADKPMLGHRKLLRIIEETKTVTKIVAGVEKSESKTWNYQELSPYTWTSYLDVLNMATDIGPGLIHLG